MCNVTFIYICLFLVRNYFENIYSKKLSTLFASLVKTLYFIASLVFDFEIIIL